MKFAILTKNGNPVVPKDHTGLSISLLNNHKISIKKVIAALPDRAVVVLEIVYGVYFIAMDYNEFYLYGYENDEFFLLHPNGLSKNNPNLYNRLQLLYNMNLLYKQRKESAITIAADPEVYFKDIAKSIFIKNDLVNTEKRLGSIELCPSIHINNITLLCVSNGVNMCVVMLQSEDCKHLTIDAISKLLSFKIEITDNGSKQRSYDITPEEVEVVLDRNYVFKYLN